MTPFLKILSQSADYYSYDLTKTGIYKIYHASKPELFYIGSTSIVSTRGRSDKGFFKRFYHHYYEFKKNCHPAKWFQNIMNKYGINGFRFEILAISDNNTEILQLEQYYIDTLNPALNTVKIAGKTIGYKHTPEMLIYLSSLKKGKPISIEKRKSISEALKGKMPKNIEMLWSKESRSKVADKLRGRKRDPKFSESMCKQIFQYSLDGSLINEYRSTADAARECDIDRGSINNAALGKRKSAGGYLWSYSENPVWAISEGLSLSRLAK